MLTSEEAKNYIKMMNDQHSDIKKDFAFFNEANHSDDHKLLEEAAARLHATIFNHLIDEDIIIDKIRSIYPNYEAHYEHHGELRERISKVYDDVLAHNMDKISIMNMFIDFSNYILNIEYFDHEIFVILQNIVDRKNTLKYKILNFFKK